MWNPSEQFVLQYENLLREAVKVGLLTDAASQRFQSNLSLAISKPDQNDLVIVWQPSNKFIRDYDVKASPSGVKAMTDVLKELAIIPRSGPVLLSQ
jgi:hypothetical protein